MSINVDIELMLNENKELRAQLASARGLATAHAEELASLQVAHQRALESLAKVRAEVELLKQRSAERLSAMTVYRDRAKQAEAQLAEAHLEIARLQTDVEQALKDGEEARIEAKESADMVVQLVGREQDLRAEVERLLAELKGKGKRNV